MSDEANNIVLRHLLEFRAETKAGLDDVRSDIGLLRTETKAAVADVAGLARKTLSEVVTLAGRVDHIETELRLADRLAALEAQVAEPARKPRPSRQARRIGRPDRARLGSTVGSVKSVRDHPMHLSPRPRVWRA